MPSQEVDLGHQLALWDLEDLVLDPDQDPDQGQDRDQDLIGLAQDLVLLGLALVDQGHALGLFGHVQGQALAHVPDPALLDQDQAPDPGQDLVL